MKKVTYTALSLCAAFLLSSGNAAATSFGTNITIWDGAGVGDVNNPSEDGEAEPGMQQTQIWDLEGVFQDGNKLSMIGGYNFVTGELTYTSGDIFISTDTSYGSSTAPTDYEPSNGYNTVDSNFGYEYVIDLDFSNLSTLTYEVLKLDSPAVSTMTAYYKLNEEDTPGSNPWKYLNGGTSTGITGTFEFSEGLTDADTGFLGDSSTPGSHYSLTGFDLSFLTIALGVDQEFYTHFTMGCGNDNLMGMGTTAPVPEPATMLLFGSGLAGLAGMSRKRRKK